MNKTTEEKFSDYIGDAVPAEEGDDDDFAIMPPSAASLPDCYRFELGFDEGEERLDKILARKIPEVSRARIQSWIEAGRVTVSGEPAKSVRQKAAACDVLEVRPMPLPEESAFEPQDGIEFETVYEDRDIIVINKPAGLVVHPAAGNWQGTLLNGLLFRYPELRKLPRAGIVHRLDKLTSGLMVVARNEAAQLNLVRQLQEHAVAREYWAIVAGIAPEAGFVDRAIGRDPRNPQKFVCHGGAGSRPAKTHCRLVDTAYIEGRAVSWVACRLETGRTHQIRVHLSTVGLPLIGDPVYRTSASVFPKEAQVVNGFPRQALHASRLRLTHPATGAASEWFAPAPEDMAGLMDELGFGPTDEPVHVFD